MSSLSLTALMNFAALTQQLGTLADGVLQTKDSVLFHQRHLTQWSCPSALCSVLAPSLERNVVLGHNIFYTGGGRR